MNSNTPTPVPPETLAAKWRRAWSKALDKRHEAHARADRAEAEVARLRERLAVEEEHAASVERALTQAWAAANAAERQGEELRRALAAQPEASIRRGLAQAAAGEVRPIEDVMDLDEDEAREEQDEAHCQSCNQRSRSLDAGGWCARCNRENGWDHVPAARPDAPTAEEPRRG